MEVAELDWGNEAHIAAVEPPFDYIIGTDVVSCVSKYTTRKIVHIFYHSRDDV